MPKLYRYRLTAAQKKVLQKLADDSETDIAVDGNVAYIGDDRTNVKLVYNLLRLCCLKDISSASGHTQYYIINQTGADALKNRFVEIPIFIPGKQLIK